MINACFICGSTQQWCGHRELDLAGHWRRSASPDPPTPFQSVRDALKLKLATSDAEIAPTLPSREETASQSEVSWQKPSGFAVSVTDVDALAQNDGGGFALVKRRA
jgi:hypothetical protein